LRRLAQSGVVFGAVVHDPVRDYVVGPRWWHRRSVAAGYSFLREAFVHEAIELDTVLPMPRLRTTVIPHGLYRFPAARRSREAMRAELELPAGARVMLAFGHIRDGKNLDLALRAMASVPDVFLVVAGREQSGGQRSAGFYQDLARQLGVAERCRWQVRHIAAEEVGDFFAAADVALLTYTRAFRSASGVLNAAVCCRKPCIASAGQGDLRSAVRDYNLGVWVEPDDVQSLAEGMRQWVASASAPRWEAYETDHSWRRNAELVLARMSERGENP
jgi:glycosyltransferase involved in cell wall biosynthesis